MTSQVRNLWCRSQNKMGPSSKYVSSQHIVDLRQPQVAMKHHLRSVKNTCVAQSLYSEFRLIGSMSPWVLPERTLGTVRYTETYPSNYLICRTVPSLLQTVPSFQPPRPTVGRKRTALRQYSLGLFPVYVVPARKCRKHYERKHAFPIIAIFAKGLRASVYIG